MTDALRSRDDDEHGHGGESRHHEHGHGNAPASPSGDAATGGEADAVGSGGAARRPHRAAPRTYAIALTDRLDGPRLAASRRKDGAWDVVLLGDEGRGSAASAVAQDRLHAALRYLLTVTGARG